MFGRGGSHFRQRLHRVQTYNGCMNPIPAEHDGGEDDVLLLMEKLLAACHFIHAADAGEDGYFVMCIPRNGGGRAISKGRATLPDALRAALGVEAERTCHRCQRTLPVQHFATRLDSHDGRRGVCLACERDRVAEARRRKG
jgi:hypothetical protein